MKLKVSHSVGVCDYCNSGAPTWRLEGGLVAVVGGEEVLTTSIKALANRTRPDFDPAAVSGLGPSFPSGHSANAAMIYLSMALLLPREHRGRWVSGALVVALMVGASRVMLGVHWPSDVVGGWAYGGLWSLLLVAIDSAFKKRDRLPA